MMAKGPRQHATTMAPTKVHVRQTAEEFFGTGKKKEEQTEEEKKEQQEKLGSERAEQALAMPQATRQRAATKKLDVANFDFSDSD